jgi:TetR/AcrR family transcriptional regulator, copper-responsive repressor
MHPICELGRLAARKPSGVRLVKGDLSASGLEGQKGCFSVNSMNQFAVLPPAAQEIVSKGRAFLKDLIARNVEAEKPTMKPTALAEMILTFFTGISMEQHLPEQSSRSSLGLTRRVEVWGLVKLRQSRST